MKKIIMVMLALSLVVGPMEAVSQVNSKVGYIRKEYRKFVDAFTCMRQSGFRKCSSGQKKRIVIAGLAAAAIVVVTSGSAYLCLRKKNTINYALFFQDQKGDSLPSSAHASMEEKPTLTFDLDDVMSSNVISISDFVRLFGKISSHHPCRVIRLIPKSNALRRQGEELAKSNKGASNIIQIVLKGLKNDGCDLTGYHGEIIDGAINPKPVEEMIKAVARLKRSGYRIIGATNQDYRIFEAYSKKMGKLGIPMGELFDWVLTTRADSAVPVEATDEKYVHKGDSVYMLVNPDVAKPDSRYYNTLREIERDKFSREPAMIIHTDDKRKNKDGAQDAGFDAIHFDLPGKTVSHSTKSDISGTVQNWKNKLEGKGIIFQ